MWPLLASVVGVTCVAGSKLKDDVLRGWETSTDGFGKFAVSLGTLDTEGTIMVPHHICGGVLIRLRDPAIALTAAHCVRSRATGLQWDESVVPYYGFRDFDSIGDGGFRFYRVIDIAYPLSFKRVGAPIYGDIAMLKMNFGDIGEYTFQVPLSTQAYVQTREAVNCMYPCSYISILRYDLILIFVPFRNVTSICFHFAKHYIVQP